MSKHQGICRLCGRWGDLTFEHMPPRRAFNSLPRKITTIQDLTGSRHYTQFQRGTGAAALCPRCNTWTGDRYGSAFFEWTKQGQVLKPLVASGSKILVPFHILPLPVIKQICVMALAMSHEGAFKGPGYTAMRQFVGSEQRTGLGPGVAVLCYYCVEGARFAQPGMVLKFDVGQSAFVYAEIALPPFGYCILDPTPKARAMAAQFGLADITNFADYRYNEFGTVWLNIPALEAHGPCALDYRTRSEVFEDGGGSWRS